MHFSNKNQIMIEEKIYKVYIQVMMATTLKVIVHFNAKYFCVKN